ncbi:hypothetical protein Bbelb_260280 [Branchiostoma belcheri]|nr:hypothetical protein Bbelb_260280 [Branchiostoma belcheri]
MSKEAIYTRALQPSLNRDGRRHGLSATYDPLLTESRVFLRDVTEAVDCSFLDKDWSCTVKNLEFVDLALGHVDLVMWVSSSGNPKTDASVRIKNFGIKVSAKVPPELVRARALRSAYLNYRYGEVEPDFYYG